LSLQGNRRIACGIIVGLLAAGAASADILVVRSLGPSAKAYPLGKRLPDNARIALRANDQLTLLDGRGTREIRGPGTFAANGNGGTPAQLASAAGTRRARIGAVRGIETNSKRPPSIWHVDVSKSANVCVAGSNRVSLWRADATNAVTLIVSGAAGTSRRLAWPAGAATLDWPADLGTADGMQYRLSWGGSTAPTMIRFRRLPQPPAGLEATASMLIADQCAPQLDLLIDTVRLPG
jgi:hypothetical protein